eukprot:1629196-Karenia_brevis.AAC.1
MLAFPSMLWQVYRGLPLHSVAKAAQLRAGPSSSHPALLRPPQSPGSTVAAVGSFATAGALHRGPPGIHKGPAKAFHNHPRDGCPLETLCRAHWQLWLRVCLGPDAPLHLLACVRTGQILWKVAVCPEARDRHHCWLQPLPLPSCASTQCIIPCHMTRMDRTTPLELHLPHTNCRRKMVLSVIPCSASGS